MPKQRAQPITSTDLLDPLAVGTSLQGSPDLAKVRMSKRYCYRHSLSPSPLPPLEGGGGGEGGGVAVRISFSPPTGVGATDSAG